MRNALSYADQLGLPILAHELDPALSRGGHIHDGDVASLVGMKGIPTEAETAIVARDIQLLQLCGGRLHIQHVSAAQTVELIRRAKEAGLPITCEVTPHHLLLTEHDVLNSGFDSNFKMMPPLRTKDDANALIDALADGTIDAIATDHAPHAVNEKDNPFDQSPSGVVGLETALSLVWTKLVKHKKITIARLIEVMSVAPARILELSAGNLAVGSYADITVFDPKAKWCANPDEFLSKSKNSPFAGWELEGKTIMTIVAGEIVFDSRQ